MNRLTFTIAVALLVAAINAMAIFLLWYRNEL